MSSKVSSNFRPKSASMQHTLNITKSLRTLPVCTFFGDGSASFQKNIKTLKQDLLTKMLDEKLYVN